VLYLDVVFVRMLDRYDDMVTDEEVLGVELPAVVVSWFKCDVVLGLMLCEIRTIKAGEPT